MTLPPQPALPGRYFDSPLPGALRLYGDAWRVVLPFAAVMLVLTLVSSLFAPDSGSTPLAAGPDFGALLLYVAFSVLVVTPIGVGVGLAITIGLARQAVGLPTSVDTVTRSAIRRFIPYVVVSLLVALLVSLTLAPLLIGVVLLAGGFALAVGGAMGNGGLGTELLFFLAPICGLGLLTLPLFIYVATRLMFGTVAVAVGSFGPIDALQATWRLTKGHLTRLIVLMLIALLPMLLLSVLIGVSFGMVGALANASGLQQMGSVLSSALGALYAPFYAALVVILWYDLRQRHDPSLTAEDFAEDLQE